jgi:hypothetical protein
VSGLEVENDRQFEVSEGIDDSFLLSQLRMVRRVRPTRLAHAVPGDRRCIGHR